MGLSVVVGLLGGRWLDGKFGSAPWLMLAGLLMGVFAGFRGLIRLAKESQRKPDDERQPDEKQHDEDQPKP